MNLLNTGGLDMRFLHKFKKYIFSPIKIAFIAALLLHMILLTNLSGEVLLCKSNIIEDKITFEIINKEDKYLNEPQKPQIKEKTETEKDKKEFKKSPPEKIKKPEKNKKKKVDIKVATNKKKEVKKPSQNKQVKIKKKPGDILQDKLEKKDEPKAKTKTADKQNIIDNKQEQKIMKDVKKLDQKTEIKKAKKTENEEKKSDTKNYKSEQISSVKKIQNKSNEEIQDRKNTGDENDNKQKKEGFNPVVRQMQAKHNYMQFQKTSTTQKNNQSKQIKSDNKKVKNRGNLNISTDLRSKDTTFPDGSNGEKPESTCEKYEGEKYGDKTKKQYNSNVSDAEIIDFTQGQSIEGVTPPGISEINQPVYPQDLREREIEGEVILELLVNKEGEVNKAKIYKTSGFEQFDRAAKEAAVNWLFTPTEKNDHKVMARLLVPIKFKLD